MPPDASLPLNEMLLRISLAFVTGLVLGYEREGQGRAAGLRTTLLTCVASALAMILSHSFAMEYPGGPSGTWRPDPGRLAAGILTGIGFLGAGTIVRQRNSVHGVTTAAVLWYATILGLIFGSGHIVLGLAGLIAALVALFLLPQLSEHIESNLYVTVAITVQMEGPAEEEIRQSIESQGAAIQHLALDYDLQHGQRTIRYILRLKGGAFEVPHKIIGHLLDRPGIIHVRWM